MEIRHKVIINDIVERLLAGSEFFGKKEERRIMVPAEPDGYFYIVPKNRDFWVYRAQYDAFDGKTITVNQIGYPVECSTVKVDGGSIIGEKADKE